MPGSGSGSEEKVELRKITGSGTSPPLLGGGATGEPGGAPDDAPQNDIKTINPESHVGLQTDFMQSVVNSLYGAFMTPVDWANYTASHTIEDTGNLATGMFSQMDKLGLLSQSSSLEDVFVKWFLGQNTRISERIGGVNDRDFRQSVLKAIAHCANGALHLLFRSVQIALTVVATTACFLVPLVINLIGGFPPIQRAIQRFSEYWSYLNTKNNNDLLADGKPMLELLKDGAFIIKSITAPFTALFYALGGLNFMKPLPLRTDQDVKCKLQRYKCLISTEVIMKKDQIIKKHEAARSALSKEKDNLKKESPDLQYSNLATLKAGLTGKPSLRAQAQARTKVTKEEKRIAQRKAKIETQLVELGDPLQETPDDDQVKRAAKALGVVYLGKNKEIPIKITTAQTSLAMAQQRLSETQGAVDACYGAGSTKVLDFATLKKAIAARNQQEKNFNDQLKAYQQAITELKDDGSTDDGEKTLYDKELGKLKQIRYGSHTTKSGGNKKQHQVYFTGPDGTPYAATTESGKAITLTGKQLIDFHEQLNKAGQEAGVGTITEQSWWNMNIFSSSTAIYIKNDTPSDIELVRDLLECYQATVVDDPVSDGYLDKEMTKSALRNPAVYTNKKNELKNQQAPHSFYDVMKAMQQEQTQTQAQQTGEGAEEGAEEGANEEKSTEGVNGGAAKRAGAGAGAGAGGGGGPSGNGGAARNKRPPSLVRQQRAAAAERAGAGAGGGGGRGNGGVGEQKSTGGGGVPVDQVFNAAEGAANLLNGVLGF